MITDFSLRQSYYDIVMAVMKLEPLDDHIQYYQIRFVLFNT